MAAANQPVANCNKLCQSLGRNKGNCHTLYAYFRTIEVHNESLGDEAVAYSLCLHFLKKSRRSDAGTSKSALDPK